MLTPNPKSTRSFVKILRAHLIACTLLTGTCFAADPVGTVVLATGAVSATGEDGEVRILGKGSAIFSGDRIITASKSLCVLEMIDDQKLSVRADSEILIADYKFKGTEDDSSVVDFVKGGFRAITGAIGSQSPDAYKVNSDLSVIGIRGTEYLTRLCIITEEGNPCERELFEIGGDREGVPEGQYLFVTKGRMYMVKEIDADTVQIDILPGQVGFASADDLKIVPDAPHMYQDTTPSPGGLPEDSPLSDFGGCQI